MRRESLFVFALAMTMATGTAFAGGSIIFDSVSYKLGRMATGRWSVDRGWTATGIRKTSHFGDGTTNIPAGGAFGPRSGIFGFQTRLYSSTGTPDPRVWLILKDAPGVTEAESDQPTDTCIIGGIQGGISGTLITTVGSPRAIIRINAVGHPSTLGNITDSKLQINAPTDPRTPYTWTMSSNTSVEEQTFYYLHQPSGASGRRVVSTLNFGGFTFRANGLFSGDAMPVVPFE